MLFYPLSVLQTKLSALNDSSVNAHAASFVQAIEGWFSSPKYKTKGFYKFAAPCEKHALYREGDSWSEQLGISYRVLRRSIASVCEHYKTKNLFTQAEDKFNGKLYASYVDRKTSQTHYIRNNALADEFFKFVHERKEVMKKRKEAVQKSVDNSVDKILKGFGIVKNGNHRDVENSSPLRVRALNTNHNITSFTSREASPKVESPATLEVKLSHQNTERQKQPTASLSEQDIQTVNEMVSIFNSLTQSDFKCFRNWYSKLLNILKENFNGCLKVWKSYCKSVASVDFLMGRAKNSKFKAIFWWLVKPFTIQDIKDGLYGKPAVDGFEDDVTDVLKVEINEIKKEISKIDIFIQQDITEVKLNQKKNIIEVQNNLSFEQREIYSQEFYKNYQAFNPSIDKIALENFIFTKIYHLFGYSDDIQPSSELIEKKEKLIQELESLQKQQRILNMQNKEDNRKVIEFFQVPHCV